MAEEGYAQVEGAELAWTVDGEGDDLVLVHAGVADQRMYEPLVALLRDEVRTVRLDLRGFGRSRHRAGPAAPRDDLLAVLDALEIERAHVLGSSFGGLVTLELAAIAPERVRSLVLLAPPLPDHAWSPEIEAFEAAEEAALEAGRLDDAVALNVDLWAREATPEVRALVGDMQRRAFELQLETEIDEDDLDPPVTERLDAVGMPVTVAAGDRDVEDFRRIAVRLAEELPDATGHRIAGAGHLPALEQPEAVAALVRQRVADDAGASSSP